MTPQQNCSQKKKKSHTNFAIAFLFLGKNKKKAMNALYAFCREVDDIIDDYDDSEIRKNKLDWWRDEVHRLFENKPQHHVTKALQPHIKKFDLNKEYFIEILDGMEMDLNYNRYENFKQLQLYCYRVASVVGILSAKVFGFKNKQTINPVDKGHIAFRTDDIKSFIKKLKQNDIPYSDYGTTFAKEWHQVFFHDPEGNVIEIHQKIN